MTIFLGSESVAMAMYYITVKAPHYIYILPQQNINVMAQ